MSVFNTLFKQIKLLSLHLKGFIINFKNAALYCVRAFLKFTAFAYSIFLICLKNIRSKSAGLFGSKLKRFAWLSFKIAVLSIAAMLFTATVKTYFFQKIMASEMLKLIGGDVAVSRVDLGLSDFSHDSVAIRDLSHTSQFFQLNVNKIDVTYDFIESMKERARIQILTFKKPAVKVSDFKGVMNALFEGKMAGVKNYDFLLKLPKISVDRGELDFADGAWSIGDLNCEITPLTDYIIFIKSKAGFKRSGCRLELAVTVNFDSATVKYSGKLLSMSLDNAQKFVDAFFGGAAVRSFKGSADCEFSGAFSYAGRESVSDFKLKPRGCSFVWSKNTEKQVFLDDADLNLTLRTNNFDISDYEISIKGARFTCENKEISLAGTLNKAGSEFNVSAPLLSVADFEAVTGVTPGAAIKNILPEFGLNFKYKNGFYAADINLKPRPLFKIANMPEIRIAGGRLVYSGLAGGQPGGLEGLVTLSADVSRSAEVKISSRGLRNFSFVIDNLLRGGIEVKNEGAVAEVTIERTAVGKSAGARAKFNIELSTLKFDALVSGVSSGDATAAAGLFAPSLMCVNAKLLASNSYELTASGYLERDRMISHYSVSASGGKGISKSSKNVARQPVIAGVLSLVNSKPGVSFNFKAAGNLAEAIDISSLNNFKFYQLIRKKIFNQNTVLNLSAQDGKLSRLTVETPSLAVDYGFDGKADIEYRYGGFLNLKGTYYINDKRLKALAKLNPEKMPDAMAGALKYLGVSDFGIDYSGGLLKISSAENKKDGALYFELKTSGLHNIAHSKISLDNVIVETADLSYNGVAEIDFNALAYVLNGRLVPTGVFARNPLLKTLLGGFGVNLAGSFRDAESGEKPEMKFRVKSDLFLSAVQLVSNFRVVFADKTEAFFEEIKVTDAAGNALLSASAELRRDAGSGANYYYVSYKSEKLKDLVLSLKTSAGSSAKSAINALARMKSGEAEKYMELAERHLSSLSLAGSLTLKDAVLTDHEFEISLGLKNAINLSAAFALDEKSGAGYKTRLMNYSVGGVTYKGECAVDTAGRRASVRFKNSKLGVAEALELLTGEKNDMSGIMTADSRLAYENGSLSFASKINVTNARVDAEKLGKLLLKDRSGTGGDSINLDIDITIGESTYIYNKVIYAMAEGVVSVKGTPASPLVSGNIDIVRGRINYLNRNFNIDAGGFKISTLKNVSKTLEKQISGRAVSAETQAPGPSAAAKLRDGRASSGAAVNDVGKYSFRLTAESLPAVAPAKKSAIELTTNISASTKIDDYDIYLTISAGLNRLNAYLTSKPELSSESIHMLLYGVKPDAASASGGGEQLTSDKFIDVINNQLQDAIYQKLSDSLEKRLNLDEVRINTYTANNSTPLGGRIGNKNDGQSELLKNFGQYTDVEVKIGKYVDPALFLSYSKNLYSPRSDSLGMEYKVRKKLFVDGKVNQNLEYRLGAKYGIPF